MSEFGIASGVRRIEAITGLSVYEYLIDLEEETEVISNILKTSKQNLLEKAHTLIDEIGRAHV